MYLRKARVLFVGVFVFLALIMSVRAEDIKAEDLAGTWVAPTQMLTVTMVFKVDGNKLTGTVKTHPADETEIKDGKIEGDKISFYIMRTQNNKKIKVRFKGTFVGNEIRFTRDADGTVTKIVAKRVRPDSSIVM